MKRLHFFTGVIALTLAFFGLFFTACPNYVGRKEILPEPPTNKSSSTLKHNVNHPTVTQVLNEETGELEEKIEYPRVIHTVWYEPEEDPRQVIGYQLKDSGIPFFDHLVMLYGIRIYYSNCGSRGGDSGCFLNGVHPHIAGNMAEYSQQWEEHFKPIRDRGIKVIMSIVPMGTNANAIQGLGVGSLYRWVPMNQFNTWEGLMQNPGEKYFADEEATAKFIEQLKDFKETKLIDGFGFDEEYTGTIRTPIGPTPVTAMYSRKAAGQNLLRFMHDMNVACYGLDYDRYDTEHENTSSVRKRRLIFENYQHSWGANLAESYVLPDSHPIESERGTTIYRKDLLDIAFGAFYGSFVQMVMPGQWPASRFGPASVAVADTRDGYEIGNTAPAPRPPANGSSNISERMQAVSDGKHGVVMYYCLRSREELWNGHQWGGEPWKSDMFGTDNKPETYFSLISNILHGEETVYVGPDYPRRFQHQ